MSSHNFSRFEKWHNYFFHPFHPMHRFLATIPVKYGFIISLPFLFLDAIFFLFHFLDIICFGFFSFRLQSVNSSCLGFKMASRPGPGRRRLKHPEIVFLGRAPTRESSIIIRHLPPTTTSAWVRLLCNPYGLIHTVQVHKPYPTSQKGQDSSTVTSSSTSFRDLAATVAFFSTADAEAAIVGLHNLLYDPSRPPLSVTKRRPLSEMHTIYPSSPPLGSTPAHSSSPSSTFLNTTNFQNAEQSTHMVQLETARSLSTTLPLPSELALSSSSPPLSSSTTSASTIPTRSSKPTTSVSVYACIQAANTYLGFSSWSLSVIAVSPSDSKAAAMALPLFPPPPKHADFSTVSSHLII